MGRPRSPTRKPLELCPFDLATIRAEVERFEEILPHGWHKQAAAAAGILENKFSEKWNHAETPEQYFDWDELGRIGNYIRRALREDPKVKDEHRRILLPPAWPFMTIAEWQGLMDTLKAEVEREALTRMKGRKP